MPTVSSYVGYSLEEPWGQPRVVFGLAAEDAEQLAGLLERHDCVGPVYAAVATLPGARDMPAQSGRVAPLPVPRQAPPMAADEPDETAEISAVRQGDRVDRDDRGDRIDHDDRPGAASGYDEPLFRQAAAAMREAALKRRSASNGRVGDSPATDSQGPGPGNSQSQAASLDEVTDGGALPSRRQMIADDADRPASASADFFERSSDDEPMGSLVQAATAARAAAETRIKAALTEYRSRVGDMHPYPDYDDEVEVADEVEDAAPEPPLPPAGPPVEIAEPVLVMPEIYATEVLEPLPRPESGPEPRPESGPELRSEPRPEPYSESQPEHCPEAASGAFSPAPDQLGPDTDTDTNNEHDADFPADDQSPGSTANLTRRNRLSRAYPIPRLTRTKRPGAVPAPDGQS